MSVAITIQLSPQEIALTEKFRRAPQEFPQAIARGMTRALQNVSGRIQVKRLTGHGPFPVVEHRLGERTGQLKLRTHATPDPPATIETEGNLVTVTGEIGSRVKYASVHEYGATIKPKQSAVERRILSGRKALKDRIIPARAPFTTGIRENMEYISNEIEAELLKSLKE